MNKKISIAMFLVLALSFVALAQQGDLNIKKDSVNVTLDLGQNTNKGSFSIENLNQTNNLTNIHIEVTNLPSGWQNDWFTFSMNDFDLIPKTQTEAITFDINISQDIDPGDYKATISAQADGPNSDTAELNIEISKLYQVEISQIGTVNINTESTKTITFTINNTGNTKLESLTIEKTHLTNIAEKYYKDLTLTLDQTTITLNPGESKEINLTIATTENTYVYNNYQWEINVSNANAQDTTTLEVDVETDIITITNFDLDETKLEPGEDIKVTFDMENILIEDLEDVTVTTEIKDMEDSEGDDLEIESSEFNLNDGETEDLRFDFMIPFNVEKGDYNIEVSFKGKGEDTKTNYEVNLLFPEKFEVEKNEDNEATFIDTELNPEIINCGSELLIDTKVVNIGNDDQEDMYIEVVISELNIKEESVPFTLDGDSGSHDDREAKKSFNIKIPKDTEEGTYTLKLYAYDEDDDSLGELTRIITVEGSSCTGSTGSKPKAEISFENQIETAKAGETIVIPVTITNNGETEENEFEVEVTGYESWATLVKLDQPEKDIAPGDSSKAYITLLVDETTESGTYKLIVNVEEDSEILDTETVLVTVEGDNGKVIYPNEITGFTKFIDNIKNQDLSSTLIILGDLLLLVIILFFIKLIFFKRR